MQVHRLGSVETDYLRTHVVSTLAFVCNLMLLEVPLRDAEVMTKPGTMMQEVAADQAIMQLMDARGTLMELKVTILPARH